MTIIYAENFQIFRDRGDFQRLAPSIGWHVGSNFAGSFRRAANLGPFGSRPSVGFNDSSTNHAAINIAAYRDTSDEPGDRCHHVRFRCGATNPNYIARIGLTDDSILAWGNIQNNFNALDIEITVNSANSSSPVPIRVYHRVPTAANGSTFNSLLIGEIPAAIANASYTLELRTHLDGANSRFDVTLNGTLYQFPFNPARLATAWQATKFNLLSFSTLGMIHFGDLVVYHDDATSAYPLGGVNVDTVEPVEAKLKVSELSDDTFITLSNDQLAPIPMTAFSGAGEVLDIRAVARLAAGTGDQPIRAEIRATRGGDVHTVLDANIPVGAPVQLLHHKLPDSFRAAPNDIVIAARGKPGV